jgi:hypothetical protein
MAKLYIGRAPLTLVSVGARVAYVYAGDLVPEGATSEELRRLTDEGYITAILVADAPEVGDETVVEDPAVDGDPVVELPAGNASLEEWQDYARTQGATDADLEGKKRDELREQYGA